MIHRATRYEQKHKNINQMLCKNAAAIIKIWNSKNLKFQFATTLILILLIGLCVLKPASRYLWKLTKIIIITNTMTSQRASELLPIIEAFAKGQPIQYYQADVWLDINPLVSLDFDSDFNWRIKPIDETLETLKRLRVAVDLAIVNCKQGFFKTFSESQRKHFPRVAYNYDFIIGDFAINDLRMES